MSLTPENEIIVRKAAIDRLNTIANVGYVLPAPIYFVDKADFFNQISGLTLTTQKAIETQTVKFCAFYPLQFVETEAVEIVYEVYLFAESSLEREDETSTPDGFLKQLLKNHSDFIAGWLGIRNEFENSQTIGGLDGFSVNQFASISQAEFISHNELCEFVTDVRGYAAKMELKAKLLANNSC